MRDLVRPHVVGEEESLFDPGAIEEVMAKLVRMRRAEQAARRSLEALRVLADDENRLVAADARAAVEHVVDVAFEAMPEGPPVVASAPGKRLQTWLRSLPGASSDRQRRVAPHWASWAITVSIVAAVLVASGFYLVAALLVAARGAGSVLLAGSPGASLPPIEAAAVQGGVRQRHPSHNVWACVASHFCDVAIVAATSVAVLLSGGGGWAVLPLAASTAMLAGTVARVAPAQLMLMIPRSPWERVIRLGGTVCGLAAAGLWPLVGGVPTVVLAAVPGALFGLWEALRVITTRRRLEVVSLRVRGEQRDGRSFALSSKGPGAGAPPLVRATG